MKVGLSIQWCLLSFLLMLCQALHANWPSSGADCVPLANSTFYNINPCFNHSPDQAAHFLTSSTIGASIETWSPYFQSALQPSSSPLPIHIDPISPYLIRSNPLQQEPQPSQDTNLPRKPGNRLTPTALLVPGIELIREGNPDGWSYLWFSLVFGYVAFAYQQHFATYHEAYQRGLEDYNQEENPEIALRKRKAVQADFNIMKRAESRRNVALIALGTTWTFNIIEIVF